MATITGSEPHLESKFSVTCMISSMLGGITACVLGIYLYLIMLPVTISTTITRTLGENSTWVKFVPPNIGGG